MGLHLRYKNRNERPFMFSGIVEAKVPVLMLESQDLSYALTTPRPEHFRGIQIGDSICVNGICLTVEAFDHEKLKFTIGPETLKVLNFNEISFQSHSLNLERSLQNNSRNHGHMVTGHVEGIGLVLKSEKLGDSWLLDVAVPLTYKNYILLKGSICLNGVSLTVNSLSEKNNFLVVSVCLIPETLNKTNLIEYKVEEHLNFETDYFVRSMVSVVSPLLDSLIEEKLKNFLRADQGNVHV